MFPYDLMHDWKSYIRQGIAWIEGTCQLASLYCILDIGVRKASTSQVIRQLVYCWVKRPFGMFENMLIKIGKFIFSVDFTILLIEPISNP